MASRPSKEQLQATLNTAAKYATSTEAAKAMGIPSRTFLAHVQTAKEMGLAPEESKIERSLKQQVTYLKRALKDAQTDADTAEKIRKEIYGLAAHTLEPPVWLEKTGKPGTRGCPVTLWSDWHYGEVVRSNEVGGLNIFNSDVAAKRIEKLTHTIIDLSFNHMGRADTKYPGIVVCLGGDMISGNIHEELSETNDRTNFQSINDLADLIAAAITTLADRFGNVFVPCVVGNHGRDGKKPRSKLRVFHSYEWNLYCSLERAFKNDKRVQFYIPEGTDACFTVYGHRYLLTHGDSLGVKGGDGIIGALGPIMRGRIKIANSEMQVGNDFDTILMGHWHQYLTLPGLIVNNSLKGYDEFARLFLRAPYSRPSQALWFTHPEHGVTAHWQVYLEAQRTARDAKKWVSWQIEN